MLHGNCRLIVLVSWFFARGILLVFFPVPVALDVVP